MTTAELPYVDPGPGSGPPDALVLDIGGDTGALLVHAPEAWIGLELDVTRAGARRSHHRHLMIRRLRAVGGDVIAGVLPQLDAGSYTVWDPQGAALAEVTVKGGRVIEVHAGCGRRGCGRGPEGVPPDPRRHPARVVGGFNR
jgi:hypothetical protein